MLDWWQTIADWIWTALVTYLCLDLALRFCISCCTGFTRVYVPTGSLLESSARHASTRLDWRVAGSVALMGVSVVANSADFGWGVAVRSMADLVAFGWLSAASSWQLLALLRRTPRI